MFGSVRWADYSAPCRLDNQIGGAMTRKIIFIYALFLMLVASTAGNAFAASTDRTVLYGITPVGTVLQINTSSGAATVVRQLPYVTGSSWYYQNLSIYKGLFVTSGSFGLTAFGLTSNDEVYMGSISESSTTNDEDASLTNLTENPSNGLSRGWMGKFDPPSAHEHYIRELNPVALTEGPVSSSSIFPADTLSPYWTCDS